MAASKPPPSKRSPAELRGQAKVIYEIKQRVDAWRGFELGTASEPYPNLPPRYEPGAPGESGLTETSRTLLLHWFRREPHQLGVAPGTFAFKYWPHQRRLVDVLDAAGAHAHAAAAHPGHAGPALAQFGAAHGGAGHQQRADGGAAQVYAGLAGAVVLLAAQPGTVATLGAALFR